MRALGVIVGSPIGQLAHLTIRPLHSRSCHEPEAALPPTLRPLLRKHVGRPISQVATVRRVSVCPTECERLASSHLVVSRGGEGIYLWMGQLHPVRTLKPRVASSTQERRPALRRLFRLRNSVIHQLKETHQGANAEAGSVLRCVCRISLLNTMTPAGLSDAPRYPRTSSGISFPRNKLLTNAGREAVCVVPT